MKLAEKENYRKRNDNEMHRQRDMTTTVYDYEAKIRAADESLTVARYEVDDLRFTNQSLCQRNADIRCEIDALHNHCTVLQNQNRDLNIELERFVQTDEQIRCTLNRRERVDSMRYRNEHETRHSYQQVLQRSPVRSHALRQPSPPRSAYSNSQYKHYNHY